MVNDVKYNTIVEFKFGAKLVVRKCTMGGTAQNLSMTLNLTLHFEETMKFWFQVLTVFNNVILY